MKMLLLKPQLAVLYHKPVRFRKAGKKSLVYQNASSVHELALETDLDISGKLMEKRVFQIAALR